MAFTNRCSWSTSQSSPGRTGIPESRSWIDDYGGLVEHQLANRPLQSQERNNPRSIGGLDRTKLDPLKEWLGPRAAVMTNRRRLDRLLMLMQLQLNELADVDAYASAIRDWLLAHRGRPTARQRLITDHENHSLLSKPARDLKAKAKEVRLARHRSQAQRRDRAQHVS